MTSEEHGRITKVATVLLLGHLLPTTTGRDLYTAMATASSSASRATPNQGRKRPRIDSSEDTIVDFFGSNNLLQELDLEVLLETCTAAYGFQDFGEVEGCGDERKQLALRRFLRDGLGPFLAARRASDKVTDLLHVLAMAISPTVIVPKAVKDTKEQASSSPTSRLMSCPHGHSFQIRYADRAEIVWMISRNFVAPKHGPDHLSNDENDDDQENQDFVEKDGSISSVFDGALVHLRLALKTFSVGTLRSRDSNAARRSMVEIAVSSGYAPFIAESFGDLVEMLNDSRNVCLCGKNAVCDEISDGCPFSSCGSLLSDIIMRHNESRHCADTQFTRRALKLFSQGLGRMVLGAIRQPDGKDDQTHPTPTICQLSSFLDASRSLFYFLLPVADLAASSPGDGIVTDEHGSNDDSGKESMLQCAVKLLSHSSSIVVRASSSLLSLAVAYGGKESAANHRSRIFIALKSAVRNSHSERVAAMHSLISVICRREEGFADAIMRDIVLKEETSSPPREFVAYLSSSIALSQPRIVAKYLPSLLTSCESKISEGTANHLFATCMSCRLAHFFSNEAGVKTMHQYSASILEHISDPWTLFRLARHAWSTSNFGVAQDIVCDHLLPKASSEQSFLYFTSVSQILKAENIIAEEGAFGIPRAIPLIQSARRHIWLLGTLGKPNFTFQLEWLSCRVDFLDLCTIVRGLCGETTLTNTSSVRGTRSYFYQRNSGQCFYSLASRYEVLQRRYGLLHCQQTRTALRTSYALCRFMAISCVKIFAESNNQAKSRLLDFHDRTDIVWPKGDLLHPLTLMMGIISESILSLTDETLEPRIRAGTMLDIIDSALKCPLPSPRGLFAATQSPAIETRILIDPTDASTVSSRDDNGGVEVVELAPGIPVALYASGIIPGALRSIATVPFSQVIAWCRVIYDGPIVADDDVLEDERKTTSEGAVLSGGSAEAGNINNAQDSLNSKFTATVQRDGRFLLPISIGPITKEGCYKVEIVLGCRDVRCGEYELATRGGSGAVVLCVTTAARSNYFH